MGNNGKKLVNARLQGVAPQDASDGLGVQYTLQGSVRTAGNRVRVTAELRDASAGQAVWTEQFDRPLDDSFELQDEITEKVLTAVNVKLLAGEQARIWHKTLKDQKALGIFYKGVHAFFQMNPDEMTRARQCFEGVAEMHPEVPTGPTWVALSHWIDIQRGWAQSPEESRQRACQWAEKAAAMEGNDGQADTVLSHVHLMERNYDEALAAGQRATTNRSGCANANAFYANVLHYCDEQDDAIRHIKLAMRYQPLYPPFFINILALAYRGKNELDLAISTAKQAIGMAPADTTARLILTSAYVRSEKQDLAEGIAAEIEELDASFSVTRFANTQYYKSAPQPEKWIPMAAFRGASL